MEKDRSSKIIAIVALVVAVIALSVGFASYSSKLNISSSASVSPVNNFKVLFSSSSSSLATDNITATVSNAENVSATPATINNGNAIPSLSGLSATFSEPGQSAEYTVYVTSSEYDAYLKTITYGIVDADNSSYKKCTATDADTTNASSVAAACDSINLKVSVAGKDKTTEASNSLSDITGNLLEKGAFKEVKVTIEYATNGAKADGDFGVTFGDISLGYDTMD